MAEIFPFAAWRYNPARVPWEQVLTQPYDKITPEMQQRYAALTVNARSEVRAARERMVEARARAEYLRDVVVPRRQRILQLTQLEYNAMLRGVFQLIQAKQNEATAQRDSILAQRDYWVARAELDAAMSGVTGFNSRPSNQQQSKESH